MPSRDLRDCSGPWTGFWILDLVRGHMRLTLQFSGDDVNGGGNDPVGAFDISGIFSDATHRVIFTKTYRTHSVEYSGTWDGHCIYGRWTVHDNDFTEIGDFEIWPEEPDALAELTAGVAEERGGNPFGL